MSKRAERHFFRVRKTEKGVYLVPSSQHDADYLDAWANGAIVEATVHKGRSRQRHRLYWAMLHAVCENHHLITSAESLHKMLLIGAGVTEPIATLEGEIILLPSSTAFEAMDESSFNEFFKHAQRLIAEQVLPGVDLNKLLNEAKRRSDTGEGHAHAA